METDSVIYSLLGRIHVIMRRVLNRITDVEYMRVNKEYAREIVRIGEGTEHAELVELCTKLRGAMDLDLPDAPGKRGGFLAKRAPSEVPYEAPQDRYVGSLR